MLELAPQDCLEAGVDECGRGPLFGPVFAGAVIFPKDLDPTSDPNFALIKDSKQVNKKKHEALSNFIKNNALAWGIGMVSAEEIDEHNILQASQMAMHRALDQAWRKHPFDQIAVDGIHFNPYLPPGRNTDWLPSRLFPKGDNHFIHIAAASIIAKHAHDTWIRECLEEYPDLKKYGIESNMGYGTAKHIAALYQHGPSDFHRKTFKPVCDLKQ